MILAKPVSFTGSASVPEPRPPIACRLFRSQRFTSQLATALAGSVTSAVGYFERINVRNRFSSSFCGRGIGV
jgi:hypothetical protein